MSQSLSQILVHLIFSTKHREPLISAAIRPRLHAYMAGILENLESTTAVWRWCRPFRAHVRLWGPFSQGDALG